jgi:hypothetical protein
MKVKFREYHRRSFIPLAAMALGAYYILVFLPLHRHALRLDTPLLRAGQRLAATMDQTNASSIDFLHITNQLQETRQAIGFLRDARQKALARIEPGPGIQASMNAPFELVEFENQRSKETDALQRLAKQSGVTLDAGVLAGLPEHTLEVRQPALLWPALSMATDLVRSAIQCKVAALYSLSFPAALDSTAADRLVELPFELEFSGSASNALQLLRSLPLRSEELRAAGWTNAPAQKPALFLDRVLLKKQSSDKLDDVRVSLRAVGFVFREQSTP